MTIWFWLPLILAVVFFVYCKLFKPAALWRELAGLWFEMMAIAFMANLAILLANPPQRNGLFTLMTGMCLAWCCLYMIYKVWEAERLEEKSNQSANG